MSEKTPTNTKLGERVLESTARLISLLGVAEPTLVALMLEEQAVLAAYAAPALPDDPEWVKTARLGVLDATAMLSGPVALAETMNCQPLGAALAAADVLIRATKEG
jgi:hypothetical protein